MQTVDHSIPSPVPPGADAGLDMPRPQRRATQRITVTPTVPRWKLMLTRERLQAAEDGGETEAHPS